MRCWTGRSIPTHMMPDAVNSDRGDSYPRQLVKRAPPTPAVEHHGIPVHQYQEHTRQGEEQVGADNSLGGEVYDIDAPRSLCHEHPCSGNDDVPEEDHRASYMQESVPSIRELR